MSGKGSDPQGVQAVASAPARSSVASFALVASAALVAMVPYVGLPSLPREAIVFAYLPIVPGWSIVRLLPLRRLDLIFGASLALSVALLLLVGTVMVEAGLWHPYVAYDGALGVTALGGLLALVLTVEPLGDGPAAGRRGDPSA
jgi:hypothetical protein